MTKIQARLALMQRVMPNYRVPFFNALGEACANGLSVFAGEPRDQEAITTCESLEKAEFVKGRNLHLLSGSYYLCWQHGLFKWLQSYNPDVLIAEANPRYLLTPLAVDWMHRRGRPVIGWGLGAPVTKGRFYSLRQQMRRLSLRNFDAIITYSSQGREEYRRLGYRASRIFIAPNATTARPLEPPTVRLPGYENGKPTVLYVGRLQERKRIDLLIRACAKFSPEAQPHLWIVGDGPVKAELEEQAAREYPQTRFFGAVYDADLIPIYQQADLFVLPGTGGLAVQQAMAHGLPVVVAEADGTQIDLVHPGNGYLTLPGDVEQLHFSIKMALEDPVRLRKMGAESHRIVTEEINLEIMIEAFGQAVKLVLEE